jgi:hypothetical protein
MKERTNGATKSQAERIADLRSRPRTKPLVDQMVDQQKSIEIRDAIDGTVSPMIPMQKSYYDPKSTFRLNFIASPCRRWMVASAMGGTHTMVVGLALWEMAAYAKKYEFKVDPNLVKKYGQKYYQGLRRTLVRLEGMGLIQRYAVKGRGTAVRLMVDNAWDANKEDDFATHLDSLVAGLPEVVDE